MDEKLFAFFCELPSNTKSGTMRTILLFFMLASSAIAGTQPNDATLTQRLTGTWQGARHSTRYFSDGTWIMDPYAGLDGQNTHGKWSIKGGRLIQTWRFNGEAEDSSTTEEISTLTTHTLKIRILSQDELGHPEGSVLPSGTFTLQRIPNPGEDSALQGIAAPRDTAARVQEECGRSMGKSYRSEKRVSEVQVVGNTIKLHFYIQSNLTDHLLKLGAMDDVCDILKAVQKTGISYGAVSVTGTYPMQDKFGNSSEQEVLRATYKHGTVDRINWAGFLTDNIYAIADDVWIHPVFR